MPRKLQTTKTYREQRTAKCMAYLRECNFSLHDARALANKREGFGANTSAWLTALGRLLKSDERPADIKTER